MLSIIVPCLNEGEGIAGTLAALAPLRARGAEVIVPSWLPPSTTITSAPRARSGANAASVPAMPSPSLRQGIIIESIRSYPRIHAWYFSTHLSNF